MPPRTRQRSRSPALLLAAWTAALRGGLCVVATIAGCAHPFHAPVALPTRHTIVREQLIVHSDFGLPTQHRLIDELTAQRGDLATQLALPMSDEPIHVYLFDSETSYDEFMRRRHPDFPERRAFFLEDDTRLAVYAHWSERVAEDLRHEVTHGYLHAVAPNIPLWLDEGLAEYFEVPRGAKGLHRPHVKLLQGKLAQGWRPQLERLEQLTSAADMTQDDYAEAWGWVHWLLNSGAQERDLLRTFVTAIRRDGAADPLSAHLRRRDTPAEPAWIAHVARQPAT